MGAGLFSALVQVPKVVLSKIWVPLFELAAFSNTTAGQNTRTSMRLSRSGPSWVGE